MTQSLRSLPSCHTGPCTIVRDCQERQRPAPSKGAGCVLTGSVPWFRASRDAFLKSWQPRSEVTQLWMFGLAVSDIETRAAFKSHSQLCLMRFPLLVYIC